MRAALENAGPGHVLVKGEGESQGRIMLTLCRQKPVLRPGKVKKKAAKKA